MNPMLVATWQKFQAGLDRYFSLSKISIHYSSGFAAILATAGRWLGAINGAGFILSISLAVATFTSMTTSSHYCVTSWFVGDTLRMAAGEALTFFWCGVASTVIAALPFVVGLWRNIQLENKKAEPVTRGNELIGMSATPAALVWAAQLSIFVCTFSYTIGGIYGPIMFCRHLSPEIIQRNWQIYQQKCNENRVKFRYEIRLDV